MQQTTGHRFDSLALTGLLALLMAMAAVACGSGNVATDGDLDADDRDTADLDLTDPDPDATEALTETDAADDDADNAQDGDPADTGNESPQCPDDGLRCTDEVVMNGTCRHVIVAGTCLIAGQCYAEGDVAPQRQCRQCLSETDPMDFSPAPDGASCDDNDPCTEADLCGDGQCMGQAVSCGDGISCTIDSCDVATGRCGHDPDDTLCQVGAFCNALTGCLEGRCDPDQRSCADQTHYQTCNDTGSGFVEDDPVACPPSEPKCRDGQCVQCLASDAYCHDNAPMVCQDGRWSLKAECVGATPVCLAGRCVACQPGMERCNANVDELCDTAGAWQEETRCVAETPICIDNGVSVFCGACDPADTAGICRADGNIYACGGDGQYHLVLTCEDPAPHCLDGACVPCIPGDRTCQGDDAMICSDQGQWTLLAACQGISPACVDDACITCNEGDVRCNGEDVMACNEDDLWETVRHCEGDTPECHDGQCVACAPGALGCDGNFVTRCADGLWEIDHACIGDTPYCRGGECVPCVPGLYACQGQNHVVCLENPTGGAPSWEVDLVCAGDERCDPAAGCLDNLVENYGLLAAEGYQDPTYTYNHATVADHDDFDPTGPITVEAWIYPTGIRPNSNCNGNGHMIVEKWTTWVGGQGNFMLAFCSKRMGAAATNSATIGDIRFGIRYGTADTDNTWVWFDDVIYLNNWYHIAAVWDTTEVRLYLNGVLMNRQRNQGDTFNHSLMGFNVQIGQLDNWEVWSFYGIIDEVRYSRGARYTGQNVSPQAYFTADANTVGLWHFDEGLGATANDTSGKGHHATLAQDAKWSSQGVGE